MASLFGHVTLIVPPGCTVVSEGVLLFGRLTDHRVGVEAGGKPLVVRLRGVSIFARVDVLAKVRRLLTRRMSPLTPLSQLSAEARAAAAKYGLAQIGTISTFQR